MSPDDATPDDPDDFNAHIQQYVKDAEVHLELPPGTITNTLLESDFQFVVKMCAVIEPLLKEAVREHVRRALKFASIVTQGSDAGWHKQATRCLPTATVAIQLRAAILHLVYLSTHEIRVHYC